MEPLYTMSKAELARLQALDGLRAGRLSQAEVAWRLGLSVRQIKRLARAYRLEGPSGILSKRRGKPSNNKVEPALLAAAIERIQERYVDFGPTFACEQLAKDGIHVKRERLRQAMIKAGIWRTKQRRRLALHSPRLRRPQFGELVQGDGSPHDWFEGRGPRCTLLLLVDDATSRLGAARFAVSETTDAYFALTAAYVRQFGKPCALYVDKLSVFRTSRTEQTEHQTQFARAMAQLDIELICANSPQAKGRVERANRTLQDRLVKELRLQNIASIEAANAFLPQFLLAHNARFAVKAASEINAHRALLATENLDDILIHVEERTVSKDLTLKFNGRLLQLEAPDMERRLRHRRVRIRQRGEAVTIEYHGLFIAFHELPRLQRPVVEAKELNAFVDRSRLGPRIPDRTKLRVPADDHPWRQYKNTPASTEGTSLLGRRGH